MGLRVKDEGASERRSVMDRIGAVWPRPKGRQLPSGVDAREPRINPLSRQCRNVGGAQSPCWCGLRKPSGYSQRRRLVGSRDSTEQVTHRPSEPTACRCRYVIQCLSRMHRNGARTVLRGGGEGDLTSLPDVRHEGVAETVLLFVTEVPTPAVLPAVSYRGVRPW